MCNDGPSWSAPAAELADLEKAELEKGGSIVVSWAPHHRMPTNFRRATGGSTPAHCCGSMTTIMQSEMVSWEPKAASAYATGVVPRRRRLP
ncbi:hypothetical protein SCARD494_14111 [Seiridium cardinale]